MTINTYTHHISITSGLACVDGHPLGAPWHVAGGASGNIVVSGADFP